MPALASNPFWDWCLDVYRDAILRQRLLAVQDNHQLLVLEVMLALWLAEQGRAFNAPLRSALREVIDPWVSHVLEPIRARRQSWKNTSSLYEPIKRLELAAERELADQMWLVVERQPPDRVSGDVVRSNLRVFDVPDCSELQRELGAIAATFDQLRCR